MTTDLRYPVGRFAPPAAYTPELREQYLTELAAAPGALRASVAGLIPAQLVTPYREGGWTVAQVVHHLPDSHINAYVRMKLAVTEDRPTIKTYDENLWAELPDATAGGIADSLELFEVLHRRLVAFLASLTPEQFERPFLHPERGPMTVDRNVATYAWHGRHHVAHITGLRERMGW